VGAGMAGISAALVLQEKGLSVRILEKSKGVGGRMASRRFEKHGTSGLADHGAQFFTARTPEFQAWVKAAESNQWIKPWFTSAGSEGDSEHPCYLGVDGMNGLIKRMVSELKPENSVYLHQRAIKAEMVSGKFWKVTTEAGQVYEAAQLILTAPVPQSLDLFKKGSVQLPAGTQQALTQLNYRSCISVMMVLDGPSLLPQSGYLRPESKKVTWIADHQKKGISPDLPVLTVHTLPKWSTRHWNAPDQDTVNQVWDDIKERVGGNLISAQVHRWQYSEPREVFPKACYVLHSTDESEDPTWKYPPLIFAGDAFGAPHVEGAWLSGRAAAASIKMS
jgi:renalase